MDIIKVLGGLRDYVQGFLEISSIQTPRYCFVVVQFDVIYQNASTIKTKIHYIPLGCHRPFKNFASELNDETVCRKFKPDHARMIIGIDTLEKILDFNCQEQTKAYIDYVASCVKRLQEN